MTDDSIQSMSTVDLARELRECAKQAGMTFTARQTPQKLDDTPERGRAVARLEALVVELRARAQIPATRPLFEDVVVSRSVLPAADDARRFPGRTLAITRLCAQVISAGRDEGGRSALLCLARRLHERFVFLLGGLFRLCSNAQMTDDERGAVDDACGVWRV